MSKFKVGDRVVIKKDTRGIDTVGIFEDSIIPLLGKTQIVKRVDINDSKYREIIELEDSCYSWNAEMFELEGNCLAIHITVKDRTTYAVLKQGKQTIKTAKAICNPSDVFNFEHGANIAFQRLMGGEVKEEVREVKRVARVGEWVKVCAPLYSFINPGEVYEVKKMYSESVGIKHPTRIAVGDGYWCFSTDEYVVLENYATQSQPKLDLTKVSGADLFAELERRLELSKHDSPTSM